MTWEDFNSLYEHYAVNDESLSDYESMKDSDGFSGEFVYDMWQMIKFVRSTQQSVQADSPRVEEIQKKFDDLRQSLEDYMQSIRVIA
jgi:hypothetical protein